MEHSLFGLDDITAIVLPILKRYFAEWDPLDPNQAENGIEMLKEWKEVIRENRRSSVFGKYKRKSGEHLLTRLFDLYYDIFDKVHTQKLTCFGIFDCGKTIILSNIIAHYYIVHYKGRVNYQFY